MTLNFNADSFFPAAGYPLPIDRPSSCLKRPRSDKEVSKLFSQALGNKKIKLESTVDQAVISTNIQAQIQHIENSLSLRNASHSLIQQAQTAVQCILECSHWSEKRKYAELGVLCYYIASGRILPPGLVGEAFLHEIKEQHAYRAKREAPHQPAYAYVLCQFTKMIFTPDGGFNLGGCCAVQSFLKGGLLEMNLSGLKKQILSVVDQLISDGSFQELFREAFEPHPFFHELIRSDMALHKDDLITFVDVRWDVLTALFLVQQDSTGQERHQYAQLLLSMLKTGAILFGQLQLPVAPFLNICHKKIPDYNFLAQLGFELLQFQKLNSVDLHSEKTRFCTMLTQEILGEFTKNLCTSEEHTLLSHFLSLANSNLFMIEYYVKPTIKNFQVIFDDHTCVFPFEGNLKDYSVFSHLRRLFVLANGELIPVDTLIALGQYFAQEVEKDIQDAELREGLKTYFISEQFKLDVAQSIAHYNQECSTFPASWYCQRNAMLLLFNPITIS